MKTIQLSKGKVAFVDDDDFDYLSRYKWHVNSKNYAVMNSPYRPGQKRRPIFMHRVIMNTPISMETDHIDNNPLNNQKSNLRICTRSQNMMNRSKRKGASKYKGVQVSTMNRGKNKYYKALITVNGKQISKLFPYTQDGELAAARHYAHLALQHFGDFANF